MSDNEESSVRFAGIPSRKCRWVVSVLFLTGLFQHLFRLVVDSLSFRRSVFGIATAVHLDKIAKVTSQLFCSKSVGLCEDFILLPQLQ